MSRKLVPPEPGVLLSRCVDDQIGPKLPRPLRDLVDPLCESIEDAGGGTVTQKELFSALLLDALNKRPEELLELVTRFRRTPCDHARRRASGGAVIDLASGQATDG